MSFTAMDAQISPERRAFGLRLRMMWAHLSIRVILSAIVICAAFLASRWQPAFAWLIAAGIPAQMLSEYLIHRFIFHLPPPRGQFRFDLLYLCHYGHHDFPEKPALFFVPIWFALPMLAGGVLLYWLGFTLAGLSEPAEKALAIGVVGHGITFLAYEWYHMTAHLNIRKFAAERRVTRLHNLHHFRDFGRNYHVSLGGEIIDRALGTAISEAERQKLERRSFIRTLGLDPADPRLIAARRRFAGKIGLSEADMKRAMRGSQRAGSGAAR